MLRFHEMMHPEQAVNQPMWFTKGSQREGLQTKLSSLETGTYASVWLNKRRDFTAQYPEARHRVSEGME